MNNKLTLTIAIILFGLSFYSCNNETTIKVSGELIGGGQDTLVFTNKITKETFNVLVNDSGKFTNEFHGEPGYYRVRSKSQQVLPGIEIYLQKNNVASFKIETENWRREQNYTVSNNPESEYLKHFNKSNTTLYRKYNYSLNKLEAAHFISVIDSMRSEQNIYLETFISKHKKLDDDFIKVEQERIRYNYAALKESYALRKKPSALPDNFFDFRKQLNYNDEKLLAISAVDYGSTVSRFILNETNQTLTDNEDYMLHTIKTCIKNVSNQKVLDHLLTTMVAPYLKDSEKFEEAYALFIENCSNEDYVKMATENFKKYQKTKKGNPSPKFVDYENCAGGTSSLDDFKGKYVYIDVWATWCGPCLAEIPHLKKVEHKYQGKNIEFVSISVDVEKNKEKWKEMVADKELGGVQLRAIDKEFMDAYSISGIPRFILIDTRGNIVSRSAPRPSNPELITLFDELGI
ncbi:TlpA family protein disulfide reductase [Saccharicrinis sp. 156]|uniref:TlpA family protein disulfide reductase n=1 Tax=Saccharicrinis sp. 156 TaxID=3417574 RepID=UPI003D34A13E